VTVTAGDAAISSWHVSGLSVTGPWNAVVTGSTVSNAPYNGTIAAHGSTSFGFLGSGTPGTPVLTCSAA